MMKNKLPYLLFALSLLFAIISMPNTAALGEVNLERDAFASLSSDSNGVLKLEGIDNRVYNLDNKFNQVGTITNNSKQQLYLTVTITPDFSVGLVSQIKIKMDDSVVIFNRNSKTSQQIQLTLSPGETMNIEGSYSKNIILPATVSFQFTATDKLGTYTMNLYDTQKTPRRITCYFCFKKP